MQENYSLIPPGIRYKYPEIVKKLIISEVCTLHIVKNVEIKDKEIFFVNFEHFTIRLAAS